MKNKKYISCLLLGLLSLTGCALENKSDNLSSNNLSALSSSSSFDSSGNVDESNSNNSETLTSSSSVSDSTNDILENNYFNENDTKLLENYFGFIIPSLDLDYTLYDYSEYMGYNYVIIYFDNATEEDFEIYINLLDDQFTFIEEGEYDSDYWYIYQEENFEIDTCYDDYSDEIPFIYVQIYDISNSDDSNDSNDSEELVVKEAVNGYFDDEDSALLNSYFDFEVPFIGNYYSLIDGTEDSLVDIYIYFLYSTEDDFTNLQEELTNIFTFDEIYYDEIYDINWYCYSTDELYLDMFFYNDDSNETYIYLNIYDQAWLNQ